jgi:hypothetical protein
VARIRGIDRRAAHEEEHRVDTATAQGLREQLEPACH